MYTPKRFLKSVTHMLLDHHVTGMDWRGYRQYLHSSFVVARTLKRLNTHRCTQTHECIKIWIHTMVQKKKPQHYCKKLKNANMECIYCSDPFGSGLLEKVCLSRWLKRSFSNTRRRQNASLNFSAHKGTLDNRPGWHGSYRNLTYSVSMSDF